MQVPLHMLASCHKCTVARDERKLLLQLFQEYCLEPDSITVTVLKGLWSHNLFLSIYSITI